MNDNYTSYTAKPELFSLETPYITTTTQIEEESDQPKKKRKKTGPSSQLADQSRHESISDSINKAHKIGTDILTELYKETNTVCKENKTEEIDFVAWAKLANVVNSFSGVFFLNCQFLKRAQKRAIL